MKFNFSFLFIFLTAIAFVQKTKIKGRVFGEQTEDLQYARITNLRTHQEAASDDLGFYDIDAGIGDTLSYKYAGYTLEKRVVSDAAKNINVVLIDKTINELGAAWPERIWKKAEKAMAKHYKQVETKGDQSGKWNY